VELTPQNYPLIATIDDEQRLVIGWVRRGDALAPVTVPLDGPGQPQAHDGEFEYTLAPQAR
jgi:hypothetical protein